VPASVLALGRGEKLGEEALRPLVAPGGADGERADDRLGHGHQDPNYGD
jgi:hypothetical protein